MNDDQLAQSKIKLVHIPTVLGAVVPIFNVTGVSDLKFSPDVLADIFPGQDHQLERPAHRQGQSRRQSAQ
jgi:phosphate transport system substrate-binding protein